MNRFAAFGLLCAAWWANVAAAAEVKPVDLPPAAKKQVDYQADIAPIFQRACYACHGPEKQRSGFRLDESSAAMKGGELGPAIVPGKSAESPLVQYIAGLDASLVMPPEGPRLTRDEIALVRAWIDQGPVWPKSATQAAKTWWSLEPLKRPEVPQLSEADKAWARTPIDAFVIATLREKQLAPSPEADAATLCRRLYFDLIGLPPSPQEVDDLVRRVDAAAKHDGERDRVYQTLVDKLLASPHYGERWARHWLDVVHYGDTHGYDKDKPRTNAWPYRDYVIRAFNEDFPYSRFVEAQIAGDVLSKDPRERAEALGFIAAGPWDFIGHAEVPETKIDGKIARLLDRDDMVSNTMNTFTSMTVQCARCHNHKFDPVTQDDYYGLQAVFAALDRADKPYDVDPAVTERRNQLEGHRKELAAKIEQLRGSLSGPAKAQLAKLDERIKDLEKPDAGLASKAAAYGYHSQIAPKQDVTKWVQIDLGQPAPLAKVLLHACLDNFNNIGAGFGFPVRFKVELSDDPTFMTGVTEIADYTDADFANPLLKPVEIPVNGQPARFVRVTATKLALRANDYIFALSELVALDVDGKNVAASGTVKALDSIEAPPRWRTINLVDSYYPGAKLSKDPEELNRLKAEREKLVNECLDAATKAALAVATREIASVEKDLSAIPKPSLVYAGTIHTGGGSFRGTGPDGGKPRVIHVLRRGDVRDPRQVVGPGTVPIVPDMPSRFALSESAPESERRAALARWLTDHRNPLTWRSIVNRVWLYHFGRGIVDSPNDFGRMGQLPSHRELLDWLAVEFRDGGQSLKKLHKLIVMSAVYRQSSANNEAAAKIDSSNVYLWRMNRRRLEAEAVRDAVLAVSGKLDRTMGGPGFQDFVIEQPAHSPHYEYHLHDPQDPRSHRRSIYRFIVRSQPQPFMTTLDCADPSLSVDKRNESLTALQALALLNNRLMITMASHFAERIEKEASDTPGRIELAYQLALGRTPTAAERDRLVVYASKHGLSNTCRVIFNLNEFVFVD
jgi:mono/diheme cytochrome c family protein